MPYKITGKILDEAGLPLYQIAQIVEVPSTANQVVSANVWTDPDTGDFTFMALDPNNTIRVEAHGYKIVSFKASAFPKVVKLQPELVIEGTVTRKQKDNSLWWALAGIGAAIAIGVATSGKKNTRAASKPAAKKPAKPKPLTVTV